MNKTSSNFTITIPVKPYVHRFIQINFGDPADLSKIPLFHFIFIHLLKNPRNTHSNKLSFYRHTKEIEILISEFEFYHYGWELTKTNTIKFTKFLEYHTKAQMRSTIATYIALGLPLFTAVRKFQDEWGYTEDIWNYEAIKKDFYRHGIKENINFDTDIHQKINKILMWSLSESGTISENAISYYENTIKKK